MTAFLRELRRRRVFTTAGLYVVGAWLVMQVADVVFPGWGIPDTGINVLLVTAAIGFPIALVFGWFFNITTHGIMRTMPVGPDRVSPPRSLEGSDYVILVVLVLTAGVIVFYATSRILALPRVIPDNLESRIGPAPAEKPPNSVAVIPFTNVSSDPENDYFCEGISEEILNKLAAFGDLHVIGRTSSWQFKGADYGIPRISELLGVRYLLEGSVRQAGDQLRISAQLVDDSGAQVWSETFDRTLTDIFRMQTEIAEIVATTVVPKIIPEPAVAYEPDVDAYSQFLIGRSLLHQRDHRASEVLRKAIDLDPGFAEPYAEWAIAILFGAPSEAELDQAQEAIDTALTLVPEMPLALAAQGLLLQQQYPPDFTASETALRKALDGDPNMVDAMNWLSTALGARGKQTEADALLFRAHGIDPLHPSITTNVAGIYARRGDVDRAVETLTPLLQVPDPSRVPFYTLGELYRDTGQLVKMNETERQSALLGKGIPYGLAQSYALLGMWDSAEYWMDRWMRQTESHRMLPVFAAILNGWKGNFRAALEDFNRSVASTGMDPDDIGAYSYVYGWFLVMAGEYDEAIEVMQADYDGGNVVLGEWELDARQALAFALIETGEAKRARSLLESIEDVAASQEKSGQPRNPLAYWLARNAALLGNTDLALERLRRAIDTGWRGYYTESHDPRWLTLADDPRFQAMMAEVKADVDLQRLAVEKLDAEQDLTALVDKASANSTAAAQ